jgi:hypothetical protein
VHFVNSMPGGERVIAISTLCVERTICTGLLVGFSAGPDDLLAHSASALADVLNRQKRR